MSYFKTMIAALFLALAVERVPAQQPLFLHATGNGAPGTITFDVHGNPNASFLIVPATGLQPITLAGLEVHVDLAFLGLSCGLGLCGGLDANGEATLTVPVPASIVGGTWFFQAFEYAPALSASNWESLTFEPAPGSGPGSGAPAWQHRLGGTAHGVFFLNADDGWVVEDGGRIRVTHDGGSTWRFQSTPDSTFRQLRDVYFLDSQRGWAVGDLGKIVRTVNSGNDWEEVTSLVGEQDLYGVHFVSATTGWVVGKANTAIKTTDGGYTWTQQVPPFSHQDWYGVDFTSPTEGWICGDFAKILHTTDGGLSWTQQPTPLPPALGDNIELWGIAMESSLIGYAAGGIDIQDGFVYSTDNGGTSWTQDAILAGSGAPLAVIPTLYNIDDIPGGGAIAVGYGSTIMTTPTPNTGWQRQENSTLTNPILRNVHAPTSNVVYTVGILGSVRKSTGAGGAGTFGDLDNPETFRLGGGDFVNPSTGWIIGQGHRIMRTDDGGVTFVDQMPFGSGFGQDIDFFDLNNGLAGGDQGFLVFTNDGGTTWSQASVSSATTNAVAMASAMDMFAVGNSGRVSYSADGGANWTQTILPGSPQLLGVDFLDPGNGLAVGAGGVCFRYAAGVWAPVPSPAALDILDVVMDGPNHGWACGLAGQVYEYDGSQLLLAHFGPQSDPLHGIAVTSTGEVWAIGSFANAAHFDGVTWTSPKVGTSEDVHAVCFVGPGEGFFIGRQNMVFAFTAQ